MKGASSDSPKSTEESLQDELLIGLADIYSYVKSRELTKAFSAYTFDDYINDAKNQIKSDNSTTESKGGRPTKIDRLAKIEELVKNTIERAKKVRNEQKQANQNSTNTSTPVVG